MNAASVIKRVDAALNRVKGMNLPMYIRTYQQGAGTDALIGRDTGTYTDTLLSPQPAYSQLGKRDVMFLTANGKQVSSDDYNITLSVNSISEDQLADPTMKFVLKDGTSEEVLRIIYEDSKGFQGLTVVRQVIARSVGNSK